MDLSSAVASLVKRKTSDVKDEPETSNLRAKYLQQFRKTAPENKQSQRAGADASEGESAPKCAGERDRAKFMQRALRNQKYSLSAGALSKVLASTTLVERFEVASSMSLQCPALCCITLLASMFPQIT